MSADLLESIEDATLKPRFSLVFGLIALIPVNVARGRAAASAQ